MKPQVVEQARQEFGCQREGLLALRDGAMQEATVERGRLDETRDAVEQLYAGARSEVANLREAVMTLGQRVTDLETSRAAGAGSAAPDVGWILQPAVSPRKGRQEPPLVFVTVPPHWVVRDSM